MFCLIETILIRTSQYFLCKRIPKDYIEFSSEIKAQPDLELQLELEQSSSVIKFCVDDMADSENHYPLHIM